MGGLQTAHSSVVGDALKAGFQNFVDQSATRVATTATGAPAAGYFHSTIVGRAPIPDISNDLRVSFGIERIMTQSAVLLQNEFGPNGEPVWAAVNDDRGLIRFVGAGWTSKNDGYGLRLESGIPIGINDYLEITFYGTGLNILATANDNGRNVVVSIDGGAEGSNIYPVVESGVLMPRSYACNSIKNVVSGLSLGVHTIKLRIVTSVNVSASGFEILNANASGLVNINTGTAYIQGQKVLNSVADSVLYNAGVTGAKGGRVVRYLNSDGTVGQAFQAVDAAAAYLASANHTNEEVVRTSHWREFGAGRTDDFSSVTDTSSGARAFTLDDGTTTLVTDRSISNTVGNATGLLIQYDTGNYYTLTFVGCGLDILSTPQSSHGGAVYIDGTLISGTSNTTWGANKAVLKVCSGLAYGTHTVKFARDSYWTRTASFIVYGPKKPTIPATAVELCDYNVMGDYGSGSSVATKDNMPTGTLRKALAVREAIYTGTWSSSLDVANFESGWNTQAGASGSSASYTFFGTGVEWSQFVFTNAMNATISIDGSSNLAGFTTALLQTSSGLSFTASTGVLSGASAGTGRIRLKISGLPLGVHTVKLVTNNANQYYSDCLDIITPIHAVKSNLYADIQNTLPVGSCSLTDSRTTSAIKEVLPSKKAWAQAVGVANGPTTTAGWTAPVPFPDMSLTIKTSGGPLKINYHALFTMDGATTSYYGATYIYVDGVSIQGKYAVSTLTSATFEISDTAIVPVSAGTHKVDIYWGKGSLGTLTSEARYRNLTVQEL